MLGGSTVGLFDTTIKLNISPSYAEEDMLDQATKINKSNPDVCYTDMSILGTGVMNRPTTKRIQILEDTWSNMS